MIVGEEDQLVCNDRSMEIIDLMKKSGNLDRSSYVSYENLDHAPFADALMVEEVVTRS